MRTMGISPGDAVLVIEHRGEQQIVYNAVVAGISMRERLLGMKGEPGIEAAFVVDHPIEWPSPKEHRHPTLVVPDVVHISHRDWIEGRAALGYEELPGSVPGVCRYCKCTERRACLLPSGDGCSWLFPERTVCSSPECEARYVHENKLRSQSASQLVSKAE